MLKILNFSKIESAVVNDNYFPFFTVKNAINNDFNTTSLVDDFPSLQGGGSFLTSNTNAGLSVKDLIVELESKEFRTLLENKFHLDLKSKSIVTTLRGYSRKKDGQIHTDSQSKIVTILLYLNLDWQEKGYLRLLKGNKNLEDYILEVPCTMGSLVAFKVTKNCWHGFPAYEGKRLSIQMNYVHTESLRIHNFRHKLSSKLKGLFRKDSEMT